MKTSSQVARDFLQATNMQSQLGAPASHQHVCTGYAVLCFFVVVCCSQLIVVVVIVVVVVVAVHLNILPAGRL